MLHVRKQITGNGNIQPTYQALGYLWEAMSGRRQLNALIFYCSSCHKLIVYIGTKIYFINEVKLLSSSNDCSQMQRRIDWKRKMTDANTPKDGNVAVLVILR